MKLANDLFNGKVSAMAQIGEAAARELYMSWEDAVKNAMARYEIVIDRYRSGAYPSHSRPFDEVMKANGNLMEDLAHLHTPRDEVRHSARNRMRADLHRERLRERIHDNLPMERLRKHLTEKYPDHFQDHS